MSDEKLIEEAFALTDAKGTGYIGAASLGQALRSMGKRLTEADLQHLSDKVTSDFGGQISVEDFKFIVEDCNELEKMDDDVESAFGVFAKTGDTVDLTTLRSALTQFGDKLTPQEVDQFLRGTGLFLSDFFAFSDLGGCFIW
jgi:Ca2+-binding EF-hand superfamily protein